MRRPAVSTTQPVPCPPTALAVAALFYSLIESAKLAGVEPRAYLGEAAGRAIRSPGAVMLARDLK